MVVVDRLVGTFEPALVIVTMAQANSATARTNTIAPSQPAGRSAGHGVDGSSRLHRTSAEARFGVVVRSILLPSGCKCPD
jgi:hypothetical protein